MLKSTLKIKILIFLLNDNTNEKLFFMTISQSEKLGKTVFNPWYNVCHQIERSIHCFKINDIFLKSIITM